MFPGLDGRAGMPSNSSGANASAAAASAAAALVSQNSANASATAGSAYAGRWLFASSTVMADPGTGNIRFDNAAVGSVTQIAISALTGDSGNPDVSDFVVTWDDSTTTTLRGTLTLRKVGTVATFAIFSITGAITDNGTWLQIPVTFVSSNGAWTAADGMGVGFTRTGNQGGGGTVTSVTAADGSITIGGTAADPTVTIGLATVAKGGTGQTTETAAFNALAVLDGTPNTDLTANGPSTNTFVAGASITVADLCYLSSTSKWLQADADAATTATGKLVISLETKALDAAMKVALPGSFVRNDAWNWTPGAVLYVSETAGAISASIPTGVDGIVRVIGFAVTADVIFFNPSDDYVTIDASGTLKNVMGIAPATVSAGFTLGTEQATTSGTTKDFTGIPAGTKVLKIMFVGVSTNGTSAFYIQIGDAGGIETTGYLGSGVIGTNAGTIGVTTQTGGFVIGRSGLEAAQAHHGTITLTLEDSSDFTWTAEGTLSTSAGGTDGWLSGSGSKSLSAELTQLRITTVSGDTFDAGTVNIMYIG